MFCMDLVCIFSNKNLSFHKWPGFHPGLDTYHLSYLWNSQLLSGTFSWCQNALRDSSEISYYKLFISNSCGSYDSTRFFKFVLL
jgi:hypothetical protein